MECAPYVDFPLFFVQGNTPEIDVAVTDINGNPIDLTDADIYLTCKNDPAQTDAEALFQLTVGSGITLFDQVTMPGQFKAIIPAAATQSLSALLAYLYDCKIDLDGNLQTVFGGRLVLWSAITQS